MNNELITIGIACYNAEATIGRAIESALGQDWSNKEIVVVDDCSTDGSIDVVCRYMESHKNIKLVKHNKNCGCPTTRNSIIENSSGEYIAFFDDDDYSYPDRLSCQYRRTVEYLQQHPDCRYVFCYCSREVVLENEDNPFRIIPGIGCTPEEPKGNMVSRYLLLGLIVSIKGHQPGGYTWGALGTGILFAHKDAFEAVGRFDSSLRRHQDWDLAIRAGFLGFHFISANNILMRQHITGGSDKKVQTIARARRALVNKYKEFFVHENVWLYAILMARAGAHEFVGNKWRFKMYRSLAKRLKSLSFIFK